MNHKPTIDLAHAQVEAVINAARQYRADFKTYHGLFPSTRTVVHLLPYIDLFNAIANRHELSANDRLLIHPAMLGLSAGYLGKVAIIEGLKLQRRYQHECGERLNKRQARTA